MTAARVSVLWGLIAGHAAAAGRRMSLADLCAVAVGSAQMSGAWVTVSGGRGLDFVMWAAGPVSEELAELHLTLGEGPCYDVLACAGPVLAADLGGTDSGRRWPGFAFCAAGLGAGAVFAFPLSAGAVRAGAMGLYRDSPGPLTAAQLADALALADAAALLLAGLADYRDGAMAAEGSLAGGQAPDLALYRATVDQATGMLTVQLGVGVPEAFSRLRAHAFASGRRLADVASDVVARRLRLPRDPRQDGGP